MDRSWKRDQGPAVFRPSTYTYDVFRYGLYFSDRFSAVSATEYLKGCLHFGLKQVTLLADDKRATLPSRYTIVKGPADQHVETDSEDSSSDSDAASDDDEYSGEKLVVSHAEESRLVNTKHLSPGPAGGESEIQIVLEKTQPSQRRIAERALFCFPGLQHFSKVASEPFSRRCVWEKRLRTSQFPFYYQRPLAAFLYWKSLWQVQWLHST